MVGLWVVVVAGLVAAMLCAGAARWGPVDRPRARGSHDRPVATGGGVSIMAAVGLGLLAFALAGGRAGADDARGVAAALAYAGALGVLGALDDLFDFGARAKLIAQALASLAFAVSAARIEALPLADGLTAPLGAVGGVLGTTLWLVVATNAVNFMDGADGLAAGSTAIASLTLAAVAFGAGASSIGAAALAGAAASLGFLPWNLRRRLFQGDAGALFSGGLLAALAVTAAGRSGAERAPVLLVPLALAPLLIDVLLTLLARAVGRRPLLQAHREHLFQLWLGATGKPHAALAWRMWALMAASSAAAWASARWSPLPRTLLFVGMIAGGVGGLGPAEAAAQAARLTAKSAKPSNAARQSPAPKPRSAAFASSA